jgi:hypothetical protein
VEGSEYYWSNKYKRVGDNSSCLVEIQGRQHRALIDGGVPHYHVLRRVCIRGCKGHTR